MYLSLVPSPHMPPGARVGWAQVLVNKAGFLGGNYPKVVKTNKIVRSVM